MKSYHDGANRLCTACLAFLPNQEELKKHTEEKHSKEEEEASEASSSSDDETEKSQDKNCLDDDDADDDDEDEEDEDENEDEEGGEDDDDEAEAETEAEAGAEDEDDDDDDEDGEESLSEEKSGGENSKDESDMSEPNVNGMVSEPTPCKFCDKKFSDTDELKQHMEKRHEDLLRSKDVSLDSALTGNLPNIQLQPTTEGRPRRSYKCNICKETFRMPSLLMQHQKQRHRSNSRPMQCSYCDKKFSNKLIFSNWLLPSMYDIL